MELNKLITSIGLTASTFLFVSNTAEAASFKTNFSQNDGPKGDVILESIEQNGELINNFSFVTEVEIIKNTERTRDKNSGAASTDKGDNAKAPEIRNEDPDALEIAKFLNNNNLNNIIDTEDSGTFKINLLFDSLIRADNKKLDSLFFFERGMNSHLKIQAIDNNGTLIGNELFLKGENKGISNSLAEEIGDINRKEDQEYANYQINTTEIGNSQKVGSWGVSLADLGLTNNESLRGIQVYANGKYQGPDFKVVARKSTVGPFAKASVPEPGTIIGLGSVAALAFVRRRKST